MSTFTNSSYPIVNENDREQRENNGIPVNFDNVTDYEAINYQQNSGHCLQSTSTSSYKELPDLYVSDCETTSILITTEIDTELKIVAEKFVEDLLLRAQKEVSSTLAEKSQVLL